MEKEIEETSKGNSSGPGLEASGPGQISSEVATSGVGRQLFDRTQGADLNRGARARKITGVACAV
jgi:hypothetical protein